MHVQGWARTPLWKRAEYMHKVDGLMKANAQPMADCLVVEVRMREDVDIFLLRAELENVPDVQMQTLSNRQENRHVKE